MNEEEAKRIEVIEGQVTEPDSIRGCCEGIDYLISTVGITDQKDGLTYMEVDYQANKNLLDEALKSGVKKFIYISVFKGRKLKELKVCRAKELLVDEIKSSGIDYSIIRPNGYFSDMREFLKMAKKKRVYLFGNGEYKLNPIHGKDLAPVCVNAIENSAEEIDIGGPEILSHNQVAAIAFEVLGKEKKVTYIPEALVKIILFLLRTFTSQKFYGSIEFLLTVATMDVIAPKLENIPLRNFMMKQNKR